MAVRGLAGDRRAVQHDPAAVRTHGAHQAFQRRAFAGAVAAEKRDDLMPFDPHGDIEQDVAVAVVAVQAVDFEQAHATTSPPR